MVGVQTTPNAPLEFPFIHENSTSDDLFNQNIEDDFIDIVDGGSKQSLLECFDVSLRENFIDCKLKVDIENTRSFIEALLRRQNLNGIPI